MALSQSVKESLEEAQSHVKNALAYAARQEESYVSVKLAEILYQMDILKKADNLQDKLTDFLNGRGGNGMFGQ